MTSMWAARPPSRQRGGTGAGLATRTEAIAHSTSNESLPGLTTEPSWLAIEEGAWAAGDKGGPVSETIDRFAALLRIPSMHQDLFGPVEFTVAASDPDKLYQAR